MNPIRCDKSDYINFLVVAQKSYSGLETSRVQPIHVHAPAHNAITQCLYSMNPDNDALWQEAQPMLEKDKGLLVLDDSTLDKPYAKQIPLVYRHWSGKHHDIVKGINLLTLLWTDGDKHVPCDHRIYDKAHDNLNKNEHFASLVKVAYARGFDPEYVCFDGWYSSLENLKLIRDLKWHWLTRLKSNRLVNPDNTGNVPIARLAISDTGRVVHLMGYGFVKVFRTIATNGDAEHWASSNLNMTELERMATAEKTWAIENYHRGLKQFCGIEKCQARSATAQRNHIAIALRAFLRLETYSYTTGYSWFEAKMQIIRDAIRYYLLSPRYNLTSTA